MVGGCVEGAQTYIAIFHEVLAVYECVRWLGSWEGGSYIKYFGSIGLACAWC